MRARPSYEPNFIEDHALSIVALDERLKRPAVAVEVMGIRPSLTYIPRP